MSLVDLLNLISHSDSTLNLPCQLNGFLDDVEQLLSHNSAGRVDIFLPVVCLLILASTYLNDWARQPLLELRKWQTVHHYWKHFRDWTGEEEEMEVSEMYSHCRPADFRYPAYPEEIHTQLTAFKEVPEKRMMQFANLPKGHLHEGWQTLWYAKKSRIRMLKGLSRLVTVLLLAQCAVVFSLVVSPPAKHVRIQQDFIDAYNQTFSNPTKDRAMCWRKVDGKGDYITGRLSLVVLQALIGEVGGPSWSDVFIYLLLLVALALQLFRFQAALTPPPIPRPLLEEDNVVKWKYALPASQYSFIRHYVIYTSLLSGLLTALTLWMTVNRYI